MVDKSWGIAAGSAPTAEERERARAQRDAARASRLDSRAAVREAQARDRQAARTAQEDARERLAERDPHKAAAQRRRVSGRKDVVREQRDTRGYAVVVDAARIRALAARGASVAGLAAVFGLSAEAIEQVLQADA